VEHLSGSGRTRHALGLISPARLQFRFTTHNLLDHTLLTLDACRQRLDRARAQAATLCKAYISASGDATRCELERGLRCEGPPAACVPPHPHPWTFQTGCVILAVPHSYRRRVRCQSVNFVMSGEKWGPVGQGDTGKNALPETL
jgi:hypothetical protein